MKISAISSYTNNIKPSFNALYRIVKDENNKEKYRNHTLFFRSDIDWESLANFVDEKYKGCDKVRIYNLACSDGSEPYTFAATLMSNIENPERFIPIMASDIDSFVINRAKEGVYQMSENEALTMKNVIGKQNSARFFKWDNTRGIFSSPKRELKESVNFDQENAESVIAKMPRGGVKIILLRNVLPYIKKEDRNHLLRELHKKMDNDSLLITGNFEQSEIGRFTKYMASMGFEPVKYSESENLYNCLGPCVWRKKSIPQDIKVSVQKVCSLFTKESDCDSI